MKKFNFNPKYTITNSIANNILKVEQLKEQIKNLPVTPHLMASLRESARTARKLAQDWVQEGFLVIVDSSKKARKYQLN